MKFENKAYLSKCPDTFITLRLRSKIVDLIKEINPILFGENGGYIRFV